MYIFVKILNNKAILIHYLFIIMKFNKLLRLIFIVMGLLCWGTLSATQFVSSDISVSCDGNAGTASNWLKSRGYTVVSGADLNRGAGGDYVYLGIKYTTDPSKAITGLIFFDKGGDNSPDYVYYEGKKYLKVKEDKCLKDNDLNKGTWGSGNTIIPYYTTDGNTDQGAVLVTNLKIRDSGRSSSSNAHDAYGFDAWDSNKKVTHAFSHVDLNHRATKNGKSNFIYCEVYKEHTHGVKTYSVATIGTHNKLCDCGLNYGTENHDNKKMGGTCSKCGFEHIFDALCFTGVANSSTISLSKPSSVTLKYTTNTGITWKTLSSGEKITLAKGEKVYMHAASTNSTMNGCQFSITGGVKATGDLTSLINRNGTKTIGEKAFYGLFKNCTGLQTAPDLLATTLGVSCYESLFEGCTSMTYYPNLKSKNLAKACYKNMFKGCSSLAKAPDLNATTLAESCYEGMFEGTQVSYFYMLPATTMEPYCYKRMFYGTSLYSAPELPATQLATHCYEQMFYQCESLQQAPHLPATQLATDCYKEMFYGCKNLNLVSVAFTNWGYSNNWLYGVASQGTFLGPDGLNISTRGASYVPSGWIANPDYLCFTAEEDGSSVSMQKRGDPFEASFEYSTDRCVWNDFVVGTTHVNLSKGDKVFLRAKGQNERLGIGGNDYQFVLGGKVAASGNIMSLLDATMQRTDVPTCAFERMFSKQTALTAAPALPATKVGYSSYSGMFFGCSSLKQAPNLPATQLDKYSYKQMFQDCTSLINAPAVIQVDTMPYCCCSQMFQDCKSMTSAPALPATELSDLCYSSMFSGCHSLTTAPILPAEELKSECYRSMFFDCPNLNHIEVNFTSWLDGATHYWLYHVANSGVFICPDELDRKIGEDYIPKGWIVPEYLCFTAEEAGSTVSMSKTGDPYAASFEYSTDCREWSDFVVGTTRVNLSQKGDKVFIRAKGQNNGLSVSGNDYRFVLGGKVAASGNIMSLLDATMQRTDVPNCAFEGMFYEQTALTTAPALPAIKVGMASYDGMFAGCSSLKSAPALPATELDQYCYCSMFSRCTSLVNVPATLPATNMANACYAHMFSSCSALQSAPVLAATELAEACYKGMFSGCSSLNHIEVNFITWLDGATSNWLSGVADSGEFICPSELEWRIGESYIPEGWAADQYSIMFTADNLNH